MGLEVEQEASPGKEQEVSMRGDQVKKLAEVGQLKLKKMTAQDISYHDMGGGDTDLSEREKTRKSVDSAEPEFDFNNSIEIEGT